MRFFLLAVLLSVCYCYRNRSAGIIGMSSYAADRMGEIETPKKESGCRWFGTAPWCSGECPDGWTEERRATSRYNSFDLNPTLEETFGQPCFPFRYKLFCCGINNLDRTWSGEWTSAQIGRNVSCRYWPHVLTKETNESDSLCGRLVCIQDIIPPLLVYEIVDLQCMKLRPKEEPRDLEGIATNGVIVWRNTSTKQRVDRWYKISQ